MRLTRNTDAFALVRNDFWIKGSAIFARIRNISGANMGTREIRSCNFSQISQKTASCNCKRKQKQRQRKPKASENKRYTQASKKANTKETKEKRTKPKASKHKQNKDKGNQHQANIETKRREHKQKQWQKPVKTCKNNANASKRKQTRAKTIKGTDMLALIRMKF